MTSAILLELLKTWTDSALLLFARNGYFRHHYLFNVYYY